MRKFNHVSIIRGNFNYEAISKIVNIEFYKTVNINTCLRSKFLFQELQNNLTPKH